MNKIEKDVKQLEKLKNIKHILPYYLEWVIKGN